MAFRSELDSMRERADAAEHEARRLADELATQRARMDRVEEVEGQLEAARASIRKGGARAQPSAAPYLTLLLGCLLGGVAVGLYDRARFEESERVAERREAEHDTMIRAAEARAEHEAGEALAIRAERDRLTGAIEDHERELHDVLVGLTSTSLAYIDGAPMDFGRVTSVRGIAPVATGARCVIAAAPSGDPCGAFIRCDDRAVHRLACTVETTTRLRGAASQVTIHDALADWSITLETRMLAPATIVPRR